MSADILFMDHVVIVDNAQEVSRAHMDPLRLPDSLRKYPAVICLHRGDVVREYPLHWHAAPELIYTRNRRMSIVIDGHRTSITPEGFVLISSGALHSVTAQPGDGRQDVLSILFQENYLAQVLPHLQDMAISGRAPGSTDRERDRMAGLCEQLMHQVNCLPEDTDCHFRTNQLLFAILQLIYRDFIVENPPDQGKQKEIRDKMIQILHYLEEHYRENLTTQGMANRFGYTREYFCRLFKRYADETFKTYLTSLRLRAAVSDIVNSDRNVSQIAINQGFPDQKSFFAAFKRKYGVTPVQWRNAQSGEAGAALSDLP